ncbi:MAG: pyridoxal phosphate-dependent aminotransferase [Anaerolineaceae bacterium]|nr:pyridoxal phosphate-dependent aminotransferase [Anaerolineaceae bacterium]
MENGEIMVTADRINNIAGSPTVQVMDKARKLKAEGLDVVDLSGGDPDFDTDPRIVEVAIKALQDGYTHYGPSRGLPDLLEAIADKTETENGAKYDPKSEIIVTPGAKLGLYEVSQALLNPGDEVILFDPCWVSYGPCIELAGAKPVYVSMNSSTLIEDLKIGLDEKLSSSTKMIFLNSPTNPSGQVWTLEQLQVLAEFSINNDLIVFSDEIYEKLIYDDCQHISIAGLPGMVERTLVLNGLSKSHAMTGWRLGWIAGPKKIMSQMIKIQQHSATCATTFVQIASVAALRGPQDYTEMMTARYMVRRDMLSAGLNAIEGITCVPPKGTFYAFPDISATGLSGMEFTNQLLEKELVAVTPGIAFGTGSEGHIRLSFANSDEMLAEAVKRINRFVASIQG